MASRSATFSRTPTRLNLHGRENPSSPPSRFLIGPSLISRSLSTPKRSLSHESVSTGGQKKRCACSPSTHPGAFRCALHRGKSKKETASSKQSIDSLKLRVLAIRNLLVKMGKDSEATKLSLKNPVVPSVNIFKRRREGFVPRPSPLSRMSKADDS